MFQLKNGIDLESGAEWKVRDSRDVAYIFAKGLYVRGLNFQGLYEERQGALRAGTLGARQNVRGPCVGGLLVPVPAHEF